MRVAKTLRPPSARAKTLGRTEGLFKVVIDARTDLILGAAIIGAEASESSCQHPDGDAGSLSGSRCATPIITRPP